MRVEVCLPIPRLAEQRPFKRKTSQRTEEIAMQSANQDLSRLRQPMLLAFSASSRRYPGNHGLLVKARLDLFVSKLPAAEQIE